MNPVTMITYPFGTDEPGVQWDCASGYVARILGEIDNQPDAEWAFQSAK